MNNAEYEPILLVAGGRVEPAGYDIPSLINISIDLGAKNLIRIMEYTWTIINVRNTTRAWRHDLY